MDEFTQAARIMRICSRIGKANARFYQRIFANVLTSEHFSPERFISEHLTCHHSGRETDKES